MNTQLMKRYAGMFKRLLLLLGCASCVNCASLSETSKQLYRLDPLLSATERSAITKITLSPHASEGGRRPIPSIKKRGIGGAIKDSFVKACFGTSPPETSNDFIEFVQSRLKAQYDYDYNDKGEIVGSHVVDLTRDQADVLTDEDRNRIIAFLVLRSDQLVNEHHANIMGTSAGGNFAFGAAAAAASGASTAFNPASTKTALSAVSSFFQTSRSLLNDEIFFGIIAGKIVETIAKSRRELLKAIQQDMDKTVDEFDVSQAIVKVEEYHNSGSFSMGLIGVIGDGSRTKSFEQLMGEYNTIQMLKKANSGDDSVLAAREEYLIGKMKVAE